MNNETDSMPRNKVWILVPRSETTGHIMTGKWALKEKSDGQRKVRCRTRGFSELYAKSTYADVLPPTTLRKLLDFTALKDLCIRHVDITVAFLHADLGNPIYIEHHHTREISGSQVCELYRVIFMVLKQHQKFGKKN